MKFIRVQQAHELLSKKSKLINEVLTCEEGKKTKSARPSYRNYRLTQLLKIEKALAKVKDYYSK